MDRRSDKFLKETKRQTVYLKRNTEVRSCNHCYRGKTISIAYSECVFVAIVIQHAMRMRHIIICGLAPLQYFFPHYLINDTIFGKEKKLLNTKCVF